MNRTSIEWCDYTWNPVTGCLHPCRYTYCYNTLKPTSPLNRFGAIYFNNEGKKQISKRWKDRQTGQLHIAKKGEIYPYGYDPTFYPHRLGDPLKVKRPSKIFVVDTGDLFGQWIPDEWIEDVIKVLQKCYWHTFMLLTKNPDRLLKFDFPDNTWLGTSISSNTDKHRVDVIKKANARIKYLSIEPLLGEINIDFSGIQWVIIGAQTGKNPLRPHKEWVSAILKSADKLSIPVFMKDNIKSCADVFLRNFPLQ